MVPPARFELARRIWPRILSPLCLPFHHRGFYFGGLQESRTPDLLIRNQMLYPAELAALNLAEDVGVEPTPAELEPAVLP